MKLSELSDIFDQAVAITDPQARAVFVDSLALEDSDRQQLQGLLAADAATCQFIDHSGVAIRAADELKAMHQKEDDLGAIQEGDQLGNYKLLQHIGEGGMGHVFLANQVEPIQRRVAVKVLKISYCSPLVLARFEAEQKALSQLDHPNITRIIDVGSTNSGRSYFVMELVHGDSIVKYCDQNKLSIRDRVALVETICQAVHHAHQKAIIHRDIKPANIMVTVRDGQAVPKVIDFGIAKALDRPLIDDTLFTRFGDIVGTPQYMSPEQASGLDLDVRTDIYSLGAVLFELLTGSPPIKLATLEGKAALAVMETVRDNDAEEPSTRSQATDNTVAACRAAEPEQLTRILRGELDWITLKALARDRSQRYESAAAMARDLRAYLDGGNVDAAAPTISYQLRKVFQRHRAMCLAALGCAVMLLVVTLVSVGWAVSTSRLRKIAIDRATQLTERTRSLEESLSRERAATKRARTAERQAIRLVDDQKEQAAVSRAIQSQMSSLLPSLSLSADAALSGSSIPGETDIEDFAASAKGVDTAQWLKNIRGKLPSVATDATSSAVTVPEGLEPNSEHSSAESILGSIKAMMKPNQRKQQTSQGLRSLPPRIANVMVPMPNQLADRILEEFRHEFGDNHYRLARALVYSCRVGLLNGQLPPQTMESRLREALSILDRDVVDPEDIAVRVETNLLLAKMRIEANEKSEAVKYVRSATEEIKTVQGLLEDDRYNQLSDELQQVAESTDEILP